MNKKILLLVVTFCLIFGFSAIASAHDVNFVNRTDFHWVELYIDYAGQGNDWGDNLLNDRVRSGEEVTLDLRETHRRLFNIKIIERRDGQARKVIWRDVNLEDASKLIMYYDRQTDRPTYHIVRE